MQKAPEAGPDLMTYVPRIRGGLGRFKEFRELGPAWCNDQNSVASKAADDSRQSACGQYAGGGHENQ